MPSHSPKQARLMAAVAHGWHKPGGGGPSVAVAKDFNQADKGHHAMSNKGYEGKVQSFANGGPVLGRTKDFLKEPDRFREGQFKYKGDQHTPQPQATDEVFGKGSGADCAPAAKGKSLSPVKPHG